MAWTISSAQPEELFRYADQAATMDQELAFVSQRLSQRLQRFEASCHEYRAAVGGLAGPLQSLARQAGGVDEWVRQVGRAFLAADSLPWRGPLHRVITRGLALWRMLPSLAVGRVTLRPSKTAPQWVPGSAPAQHIESAPRKHFGDLLREEQPLRRSSEDRSGEQKQATETGAAWGFDVPPLSQHGITTPHGAKTEWACVPTSVAMVVGYWHGQDPANRAKTAQELVDINARQGTFRGTGGMSISNLEDELTELGYTTENHLNAGKEDLKAALARGPVVAIVKLNMAASGTNHSVVVTGISDDGRQVRINDPWTGGSRDYSWEDFERSWGAEMAGGVRHVFTGIRPR